MAGQSSHSLKLLGMFASPFALRVQLALSFKGLRYEYLEEKDLHNNKSELLLKSNPVHKRVPVLIHDGKPVCESTIIVQYLDEAFAGVGPSLLPSDPHERAVARFWAAYIDEKFQGKPFFSGDSVGYVDVSLGGFVAWVHAVEKLYGLKVFDDAKTPLLAAWLERFGALDAARAVMPDTEKLVGLARMTQAQAAAAAAAAAQGN